MFAICFQLRRGGGGGGKQAGNWKGRLGWKLLNNQEGKDQGVENRMIGGDELYKTLEDSGDFTESESRRKEKSRGDKDGWVSSVPRTDP